MLQVQFETIYGRFSPFTVSLLLFLPPLLLLFFLFWTTIKGCPALQKLEVNDISPYLQLLVLLLCAGADGTSPQAKVALPLSSSQSTGAAYCKTAGQLYIMQGKQ